MKEEIDNILEGFHLNEYGLLEVRKKLLDLFNVSQRSELFKGFLEKVVKETYTGDLTWQTRDEAKELLKLFNCG